MTAVAIDEAFRDPHLLGAGLGDANSWSAWLAILRAAFGLPLRNRLEQGPDGIVAVRAL